MNKKAGIRFNPEYYVDVNMDDMMVKVETPEGVTEYPLSGGGGWTETKVWENPNPNVAQLEVSDQTPESLKGYAFFKVVWKDSINIDDTYISVNDVQIIDNSDACITGAISLEHMRRVTISSDGEDNSVSISNSISNTGDTDNTTNIILAIYGIKQEV